MESHETLWISGKDNQNLEEMYNETFSAVRVDGELSDWFVTIVGVL